MAKAKIESAVKEIKKGEAKGKKVAAPVKAAKKVVKKVVKKAVKKVVNLAKKVAKKKAKAPQYDLATAKRLAEATSELIARIKQQKGVSLIQLGGFNKEGSILGALLLKKQSFNTVTSVHTTFSVVNLAEVKEVAVAYYFFICSEDKGTDFYADLIPKDLGEAGCIFKIVKSVDDLISTLSAL